ncbi:Serine/threonine-protein phosphatase 4 regulatory subunit 4, partial [Armadillidium vulgare]
TRSDTLVPLVKKVCERSLRVEDVTLPVTAHLLGRICHGLHDDLTKEQKDFFINYYCTLSKLGLPDAKKTDLGLPMPDLVAEVKNGEYEAECRQQCAYNFPAMVLFAGGPTGYRKHLHDILISFVTDPSLPVRNTIALSFHQLCTLIGSEVGILRESFLNLLRSENLEVVAALVPNISHILAAFNHHQVLTQSSLQTEVLDLVGALKQGEESLSKSSNWRVHSEILRQIAALALCLPADLLFSEVVPLMIHRMHTSRPIPCRQAAARTLLVFLRHMDTEEHRDHINKTLVIEFCEANSCHKRMLFLSVCQMALELLPLSSFKHSLFEPLLALHTDSVPNIRLKVVSFLPILKGILSLPEDRQRLQDLETAVGSLLMKESDKDVSALITEVIGHLDKIEVSESKRESPEGQEMSNGISDAYAERRVMERDNKSKGGTEGINGSNRRVASPRKIPSYVVAQRRKSHNFAPELPPDEKAVKRISSLDPSADEFLIDAGVRIDEASFCSRIPPPSNRVPQRSRIIGPFNRHLQSNVSSRSRGPSGNISKIPVVGRNSESLSSPPPLNTNSSPSVDVKTRQRVNQRHNRPVSSISTLPPTRISIGGSRGKSLSHENLRSSARIGMSSSSSAKTSPVSSRPSSPNRISAMVSRGRQSHPNNARRPSRNVGNSPSGSRCSSPGGNDVEGGRNRRGSSATSSPPTSRCPSPGIDDAPRGNIQKRAAPTSRINSQGRTRTVNVTVPNVSGGGSARGRGSKLPLPTSKK